METITAADIINDAANTLQDDGNVTWTRAELLVYASDSQRAACIVKPDAFVKNVALVLVAGTVQNLPDDGNAFVRIVRNMGTDGATPGRAPRSLTVDLLDRQNPNWHGASADPTVLEYAYDERDPKRFYVSPPQPAAGQGQVQLVYQAFPPALAAETDQIALDAVYRTVLMHYVCYRAYLKNGELQNNLDAQAHRAEFLALLGAKDRAEDGEEGGAN